MIKSTREFRIEDFDYELPKKLIAFKPAQHRDSSRLLIVSKSNGRLMDQKFSDLLTWLRAGDLLVLNDTKVFPARLLGSKDSGGKVEMLAERILSDGTVKVQIKSNRAPKIGSEILIAENLIAKILNREEEFYILQFNQEKPALEIFEQYGHVPLPPYIEREDEVEDLERYQTIYAKHAGAVAAPTAGLHFTSDLLSQLTHQGVQTATITLHVGAGTFKPVKVQDPTQHIMHSEHATVSQSTCEKIEATKSQGGRVVAVGTTCVRALESAAVDGNLNPYSGETDIFIYPGFVFNIVDALITNFHLPRSTLLMLVSAFAGHTYIKQAYQHAIQNRYRFYSYGDAMLITE